MTISRCSQKELSHYSWWQSMPKHVPLQELRLSAFSIFYKCRSHFFRYMLTAVLISVRPIDSSCEVVISNQPLSSVKIGQFLEPPRDNWLLKNDSSPWRYLDLYSSKLFYNISISFTVRLFVPCEISEETHLLSPFPLLKD
jgi:hypothetical protein